MGTEQQQEFKSVKPCTKPKRKVIPFNDHSIEAWRPKKDKDRIVFAISNTTKGIKVIYRKKTNQKYWELTYYLKKKELTTSLGPFIPDALIILLGVGLHIQVPTRFVFPTVSS